MAKYSNTVEYQIKTNLDTAGITKLQTELSKLKQSMTGLSNTKMFDNTQALKDIDTVQKALQNAFNPKLGMLSTSAFTSELKAAGRSLQDIHTSFSSMGAAGERAFTSMYGQISKIDTGLRSVSSTTDKIMNTLGNTIR